MSLQKEIQQIVDDYFNEIVSWRRKIHSNPELAFEEKETAAFISSILTTHNIEHKTQVAKTGIVAIIKGKNPDGKCVALRADMDALPIVEKNTHDFVSENVGKMHACGHDFHTASLLGVAIVLNTLKSNLTGTIKLIFQPAEEKIPSGAPALIEAGVLENPKVDYIIGQHVSPELPTGTIGIRKGTFMASADEIYLTVKGKGGHAAIPQKLVDPILISAQILLALQQVVSRKTSPFESAVLSFGRIEGLGATNVIPNEVKIAGTLRAMNEEYRKEAHSTIEKIAKQTAEGLGGECEVNILVGYPCVENDEKLSEKIEKSAKEFTSQVQEIPPRMGAEDFAYYSQKIPACFYRIGTGGSASTQNGLHTSSFDVDENAFKNSVGVMAWLALSNL